MIPATNTTADAATTLLLRVSRDGNLLHIHDLVGTRYGVGETLAEALAEYAYQVADLVEMTEPTGPPLSVEQAAYRRIVGVSR